MLCAYITRRSPFAVRRSPFAVRRSPFAVLTFSHVESRSPFSDVDHTYAACITMNTTFSVQRAKGACVPPESVLRCTMDRQDPEQQLTFNERFDRLAQIADRARTRVVIPRSPNFTRGDVVSAITSVFEMIGGIPRFAVWANENEGEYYKIYAKLMPSQQQVNITVGDNGKPREMTTDELNALAERVAEIHAPETTFRRCEDGEFDDVAEDAA